MHITNMTISTNNTIDYTIINNYIYKYMLYIIKENKMSKADLSNEDKYNNLLYIAADDWMYGYDFIDWLSYSENVVCEQIMSIYMLTDIYRKVNTWYSLKYDNNYLIDWTILTPSLVLRHYLTYFINYPQNEFKSRIVELL